MNIPMGALIFTFTSMAISTSMEEVVLTNIDWIVQGYDNKTCMNSSTS